MTKKSRAFIMSVFLSVFGTGVIVFPVGATTLMVATWNWGGSDIFQVDSSTGESTFIGSAGVNLHGLTYIGDTLYGYGALDTFGGGNLYTIDEATGAASLAYSSPWGSEGAVAYNSVDGYAYHTAGQLVARWDLSTGVATRMPSIQGNFDISGLAYIGADLYGIGNTFDSLYTINTSTGIATEVGPLGIDIGFSETFCCASSVAGLTYDGSQLLMVTRAGETSTSLGGGVYTINPATGEATLNALFSSNLLNQDIGGVAAKINTIPIPAAVWLFCSGLMGLIGVARRKMW